LTPEQLAQLREIRRQSTLERRQISARLRQAQRALDAAIFADATDEALIERYVQRVAELQREVVRLRAFTELKIRRLLTPQQLQALREMRESARQRRANLRHHRGDRDRRVEPQPQN
jgi:Spy/CpxP family protein refolding chaperone